MIRFIYTFIILLFIAGCNKTDIGKTEVTTPLVKTNFTKLTQHEDILNYLEHIDTLSEEITIEFVGESVEGRKIPLVKVSGKGDVSEDQTNIFFFAQQHGDEPSGKEGLLLLLNDFAEGKHGKWLKDFNLLIMPQVNPDGGDMNQRRNANGIDLNRDHLVLKAPETQLVHKVFNTYKPEVTVDIHEYYPYSDYWKEFGYLKDFDIQLGGLTNMNVDSTIINLFYDEIKPFVNEKLTDAGYSFFEYTLGDLPGGERLRHSTVDVNDGRQSFGILNTLSFIVEGKSGKDSVDNLERRAKSQYATTKSLLEYFSENSDKIDQLVNRSRKKLVHAEEGEEVAIRMRHVRGDEPLKYPLKSLTSGKDTVFIVENFHTDIESLLSVKKPTAYLIPVEDEKLINWLDRSFIAYYDFRPSDSYEVKQYQVNSLTSRIDEGLRNYYPKVELIEPKEEQLSGKYFYVPVNQLRSNKIVTALEPQSMLGLINYTDFEYLIKSSRYYPVMRVTMN